MNTSGGSTHVETIISYPALDATFIVVAVQSGQHYGMTSELWKDGIETDELLISAFGEETVCRSRRFEVGSIFKRQSFW